jgi:peptidoglycan/LPS O-acetylase OafA/YrhL
MERVKGFDQLRFLMAVIVLISHGTLPTYENNIIRGILGNIFSGIAAVMIFFMLSGFVIHYSYATGEKKIKIVEFYFRRLLRIIIPAVIAIILYCYPLNVPMIVIWSLICEAIYYLLYPLVLKFIKKIDLIIFFAFVFSYIGTIGYSIFSDTYNGNFHRLGDYGAWITGFPMWLLGVKLSILYVKFKSDDLQVSFIRISIIRMGIIFLSGVASILRFHYDIAFGYTLPIFSLVAFFWLKNELIFYLKRKENKVLEYGGGFSYSIYLMHYLILFFFLDYLHIKIHNLGYSVVLILFVLLVSWVFYLLVEKPSHRFSRSIKFDY